MTHLPMSSSPQAPSCSREAARRPERRGQGKAQGRQPPPVSKDRNKQTDRRAPSERHAAALGRLQGQSPGGWAHTHSWGLPSHKTSLELD